MRLFVLSSNPREPGTIARYIMPEILESVLVTRFAFTSQNGWCIRPHLVNIVLLVIVQVLDAQHLQQLRRILILII